MSAHRLWIQSGESARTNNAPGAETPGGAELVKHRSGDRVNWTVTGPFSHSLQPDARRAVPMSQHITVARAREARERLLAVAEACTELGVPLPERARLAKAIGCTPRQMARYMALLIAEGVVERRTWKWRMAA